LIADDALCADLKIEVRSGQDQIVDLELFPRIDACAALKRDLERYVPIIVLLPEGTPLVRRQALSAGADDCLETPVDVDALLVRVRSFLRIKALQDRLREIDDLRRQLTDAVSHDLRSPLVSLLGFSRLLRRDHGDGLAREGRYFLDRIEQAGRTMESLIHDLLELSRIGRTEAAKSLIDPRSVLAPLYAEFKPRLDQEGVSLELPENPPLLMCNRTRLYQLFSNLVGNALEHMGSVERPTIRVEVRTLQDAHQITVSDNGKGIDPAHHGRIFEIFQSLGPRKDGRRGTGIGLAIVKKIVETHGGRVWVESDLGKGARFHLTLSYR